jgi:O-antigen ligase
MASLAFWYPFVFFMQPGVLWPGLAPYLPLQIASALVLLCYAARAREYRRGAAFGHPAFKWMLAYMCVQGLSVIHEGVASMASEFGYVLPLAEFVLLSTLLITTPENFRRYLWGVMAGSIWLVGYGIYAFHNDLRGEYGGLAGAYGNYENHNDYTFVIIQVLPFVYMMRKYAEGKLPRLVLGASLLACVHGTLVSMSRGGMIALVAQVVFIVMYTMPPRRRALILPIVLLVGAMGITYQYARRAEANGDNYTAEDAKESRFELWKAGRNMVLAHPILGVGNRRFAEEGRNYGDLSHDQVGKNSHNTYIEVAATTGLLGTLAFGGMLLAVRRELKLALVAPDPARVDAIRLACLIALYAMLLRAFFDAKDHDWSFYFFVVVAMALRMHRERFEPVPTKTEMMPAPLPPHALDGTRAR